MLTHFEMLCYNFDLFKSVIIDNYLRDCDSISFFLSNLPWDLTFIVFSCLLCEFSFPISEGLGSDGFSNLQSALFYCFHAVLKMWCLGFWDFLVLFLFCTLSVSSFLCLHCPILLEFCTTPSSFCSPWKPCPKREICLVTFESSQDRVEL